MSSVMESVDQRTQLAGRNRLELLLFRLTGNQRFGINVFKIQEVVHCPPLTQIPHSHAVVRGIATMRGKTIPVIDLSLAVGEPPVEDLSSSFVIVTEYNRSIQGFLVGGVDRIVNLNWTEILPPPKGSGMESYLTAVTKLDEELVEIIDVEKVLAEVNFVPNEVSEEVLQDVEDKIRQQQVLVVDDSGVARNQMQSTFEQLGIQCTMLNNGGEALKLLKEWADNSDDKLQHLAVVVSDIEMPVMDGYTLTTEIRKDPRLANLYILLHTSLSGTFNHAMVDKVGANEFVPKFNPDELAIAVKERIKIFIDENSF
jgi:two-component system chemotaxis response regulator CheV